MKNKILFTLILGCLLNSPHSFSQAVESTKLKSLTDEKLVVAITNLRHFLKLQNDGNFPEQINKNKQ